MVVPPPVAVGDFPRDVERDPDHFLWVHRLVPYKRPLEVAAAFGELPDLRLTMVGVGPLEARAARRPAAQRPVAGLGSARRGSRTCSPGAAGFIHVGEEDFGISMVEALAAGTPVLAAIAAGRDIVRPGVDGVLISDPARPGRDRRRRPRSRGRELGPRAAA